ncbi:hypothetical protein FRC09_015678 [Ceratobasidium sp. 395]|nr:hypothetical protein FRC09_015678 [Ceratobasidium sp. 395]
MPHTIGVDEVVAVAPAVRHFEGPAFLVKPLLQSEISGQLESLSICGTVFLDKELELMMQELSRTPLSKLSALRTLRVEPQISFKHLTHILKAAPELERLEFFGWINSMYGISEYSDDLLQMLKLVPCLRVLTVTKFNKIDDQDEQDEQDEYLQLTHASVMRFLDHATATCPQLDTIHHMEYGIWVGTWRLRELGSNERVRVYAYRKLYHLFPSLGVLCVEYPDRLGPWHRLHEID